MRIARLAVPIAITSLTSAASMPAAFPPQSMKGAVVESHEALTVSAQPWLDPALYKEKFHKKSPYSAGVVAIEVTFRNDSSDALDLTISHIRLNLQIDEENRQELHALEPAELAAAVYHPESRDPTARSRVPLPIPARRGGGSSKDQDELQHEAQDAGLPSNVIAPHSTMKGLLYFDLQGQFDLLTSARLYIPDIQRMDKKESLTFFEIDLGRAAAK
jgi:hypothetical protein